MPIDTDIPNKCVGLVTDIHFTPKQPSKILWEALPYATAWEREPFP